MKRVNWLPAPAYFHLNQAVALINDAFSSADGSYLVGSCLERRDFRDVDIRTILADDLFDRMFPRCKDGNRPDRDPFWSLLCVTISEWLSSRTGLQIDYQIQRLTQANDEKRHPGDRQALGIFLGYPGGG